MKKEHEQYILGHAGQLSPAKIARHLDVNEKKVREFLKSTREKIKNPALRAPAETVPSENSKGKTAFFLFGIFILGALIYSNSLQGSFHFDDYTSIVSEPAIRNFSKILEGDYKATFISYLTFVLNYQWGKSDPFSYHLVNLLIHIATSGLIFFLFRITFKSPRIRQWISDKHFPAGETGQSWIAFFAALIFLCHPVQTEAVAYIVQRVSVLATFFYAGTIALYAKARLENKKVYFLLSFAAGLIGMFTKQTFYTLPFTIVLYEACFFDSERKTLKERVLFFAPYFALLVIVYFTVYHGYVSSKGFGETVRETSKFSRASYFLTELNVLRTYLRLFLLPVNQNLDYDYPIAHSLADPQTALSFLLLAGLAAGGIVAFKKKERFLSFGIFWFFITLSVESSIIPISDVIFEHRLYLPMTGLSILAAAQLWRLLKSKKRSIAALSMIVLFLSGMTYARNNVWKDEFSLWRDAVKKSPKKGRPYNNIGLAYDRKGEFDQALKMYTKAIEIDPDFAEAYVNRGQTLEKMKDYNGAIEAYKSAVERAPNRPEHYANLGTLYGKKNDWDRATEYLLKAINKNPRYVRAYNNLAVIYNRKGETDKEIEYYLKALEIDPGYAKGYGNLGIAYGKKGDFDRSIECLSTALELDPTQETFHFNLGVAYNKKGDASRSLNEAAALEKLGQNDLARKLRDGTQ